MLICLITIYFKIFVLEFPKLLDIGSYFGKSLVLL